LVVGSKEASSGKVSVRKKGKGDLGVMSVEDFIKHIEGEIKDKA
jgi:threonyl-tRNA synthetase